MEKEYEWNFTADGAKHSIRCMITDSKCTLFLDDAHWKTVFGKYSQHSLGSIDEDMRLWGRPCHLVVWPNGEAEFVYDGRSLSHPEEDEEDESEEEHSGWGRKLIWVMGIAAILAGIGTLIMIFR